MSQDVSVSCDVSPSVEREGEVRARSPSTLMRSVKNLKDLSCERSPILYIEEGAQSGQEWSRERARIPETTANYPTFYRK